MWCNDVAVDLAHGVDFYLSDEKWDTFLKSRKSGQLHFGRAGQKTQEGQLSSKSTNACISTMLSCSVYFPNWRSFGDWSGVIKPPKYLYTIQSQLNQRSVHWPLSVNRCEGWCDLSYYRIHSVCLPLLSSRVTYYGKEFECPGLLSVAPALIWIG